MNKYVLILLIIFSFSTESSESIDGNVWMKLSDDSKYSLIIGYDVGVKLGSRGAIREVLDLKKSCEFSKDFNPEDKCLLKRLSDERLVSEKINKKYRIKREYEDYVDSISYIYKDPANREIPWFILISIVRDKYDGKDVSKDIIGARKYKANFLKMINSMLGK